MLQPMRLQFHRKSGFRMIQPAARCARPHKYGNPYDWRDHGKERCIELYRSWILTGTPHPPATWKHPRPTLDEIRRNLRGKNLYCDHCPEGTACHCDVLLEIANTHPDWPLA